MTDKPHPPFFWLLLMLVPAFFLALKWERYEASLPRATTVKHASGVVLDYGVSRKGRLTVYGGDLETSRSATSGTLEIGGPQSVCVATKRANDTIYVICR